MITFQALIVQEMHGGNPTAILEKEGSREWLHWPGMTTSVHVVGYPH